MIDTGFIEKKGPLYLLTNSGKEYANRMDTDITKILTQAKIGVIIIPFRGPKSKREFLIYTRLKQPFYGCQGFMSGKIRLGEQISASAKRELKEETNLMGEPQIVALKHYRVFDKNTEDLVEDKFLFYCKVENPVGKLIPDKEGKYEWVKRKDLRSYVTNHFESFDVLLNDIKLAEFYRGRLTFLEIDHLSRKF